MQAYQSDTNDTNEKAQSQSELRPAKGDARAQLHPYSRLSASQIDSASLALPVECVALALDVAAAIAVAVAVTDRSVEPEREREIEAARSNWHTQTHWNLLQAYFALQTTCALILLKLLA